MNKMKIKKAFTLAEVLLTLTVIGIVSAMAIPSLMTNLKDNELRVAFKKKFAELSQATNQMIQDNGGTMKGFFINPGGELTTAGLAQDYNEQKMSKYLNITKICTSNNAKKCWHASDKWYQSNGNVFPSGLAIPYSSYHSVVLNDGTLLLFIFEGQATAGTTWGTVTLYLPIYIDVNGFKAPNTFGRDIFEIDILENKLVPSGAEGTGPAKMACGQSGSGASGYGGTCGLYVLLYQASGKLTY